MAQAGREMRLQIELPRRDVHDLALVRRRLYELTTECRFIEPVELALLLTIVDRLFRSVEHARTTKGFTWNTREDAAPQVGVGAE